MRFTTFITSCIAAASYSSLVCSAPLSTLSGSLATQHPADILAQSELDAQAGAETEFLEGLKKMWRKATSSSTRFDDPNRTSAFLQEKLVEADVLQNAMGDLLYEVGKKEQLWASKGAYSQWGGTHDYCLFDKSRAEEIDLVVDTFRVKLDNLFTAIELYDEKKRPMVFATEAKWNKKKKKSHQDYLKFWDDSIKRLEDEVKKGTRIMDRDAEFADATLRLEKDERVADIALGLTGWHRGQLAVPNAWAGQLIDKSCKRQKQDEQDILGGLAQVALAKGPKLLAKAVGLDQKTADFIGEISGSLTEVIRQAGGGDRDKVINELGETLDIDAALLGAIQNQSGSAIQNSVEQLGQDKVVEVLKNLKSDDYQQKISDYMTKMKDSKN